MSDEKVKWPYVGSYIPSLQIIIESPSGSKYPNSGTDFPAHLDTCFDGDILLPGTLYQSLGFAKFESYSKPLQTAGSDEIPCSKATGHIYIPKINERYEVEFLLDIKGKRDTSPVLIGNRFIKKLRLVLDGPNEEVIFCYTM